jgi:hypothetical protein
MADEDYSTDEGGGGGEQTPAQTVDLSPIEDRLNRITQALTGITRDNEVRDVRDRIGGADQNLRQRMGQAEAAVSLAERRVAEAYDTGESVNIARAQRNLTEAIAARVEVQADRRDFDRQRKDVEQRVQAQTQQQPQGADEGAKDTRNLNDWKSRNSSWYGVDADMTKAAHEVDKSVRAAGVIPVGSQEYFKAIDRQMAQRYPEKLRSMPDTAGSGDGNRNAAPRGGGRIPNSVLDAWAHMGIDVKDDKTLARMIKNQEALVSKGILPVERNYGPVMTR